MSRGPWSIKGIDSRARQKAREQAQKDGLTLGEYLNRLLIEDDERSSHGRSSYTADPVLEDQFTDVIAEVDALADRLRTAPHMRGVRQLRSDSRLGSDRTPDRAIQSSRRVEEEALREIIDRLDSSERSQHTLAERFDGALSDLHTAQNAIRDRLERVSRHETSGRSMEAMRALEGALSRLSREVHETRRDLSDEQAQLHDKIDRAVDKSGVENIARRLNAVETDTSENRQRVDDSLARLKSEADRISAASASHDKKLSDIADKSETAYETARTLSRELGGRLDAAEHNAHEAVKAASVADQRADDLRQRLQSLANLTDSKLGEALNYADAALARAEDLEKQFKDANPASSEEVNAIAAQAREALDAARETTKSLEKRIEASQGDLDTKIDSALKRVTDAVDVATRQSDVLASRIDDSEARQSAQLQDVLESTAGAIRAARAETVKLSERFDAMQADAESTVVNAVNTALDQNKHVVDGLSTKVDAVESRFDAGQKNVSAIMGRVSELGAQIEKGESKSATALETLQAAMTRINQRLDRAEDDSRAVTDDIRNSLQHDLNEFSENVAKSLQTTREDLERQIAETVTLPTNVSHIETRIEELQQQIADTDNRQAEAVEVISAQFERMSAALDERLRDVEDRGNSDGIGLDELRTEITRISEGLDDRLKNVESRESTALESVAQEVAQMAEKLETRVKDTEARSASAIDQVGEQVARVSKRLESSQAEIAQDLSDRMDAVSDANKSLLQDAVDDLGRKITDVGDTAAAALGPVQNTVASLARRMEEMEDFDVGAEPPPFNDDETEPEAPPSAGSENEHASPETNDEEGVSISDHDISSSAQEARREFVAHLAEALAEDTLSQDDDIDPDFEQPDAVDPLFDEHDGVTAPLPSAFDALDESAVAPPPSTAAPEYEADLPPAHVTVQEPEALRIDEGDDDDPFARSTVNSLDFLSAARQAALERGGDNRQISNNYGQEAEEDKRSSKLPMMAAGALAIAVAGGAGMTMMRGKQANDEDAFAATKPVGGEQAAMASVDAASSAAVDETELFEEQSAPSKVAQASAAVDDDVLFKADARASDQASAPEPVATPISAARASAAAGLGPETAPALQTSQGPRKASALEAFASQTPPTSAPAPQPKVTLEQAAADGDPVAMHDLAIQRLAEGDKKGAADMMTRAANRGLTTAQYRLAKLFERGEGVPRSVKEARKWTQQAASAGNVKAMHDVAVFFAEGEGGEQSYVAAVDWFTKAANHGLLDSQYNLGVLYEQGLGVSRNLGEAALWFEIAGRNGDADAARRGRDILSRLSPQEADTARRRATVFSPLETDPRANGIFGRKAWEAPLKAQVQETQRLLNMLNYNAGAADGVMGARTRAAISRFEADNNLTITGRVSSELVDILRSQSISG